MLRPEECLPGCEQYELFRPARGYKNSKNMIQYDYRTKSGTLFSTCAETLQAARTKRDKWLHDMRLRENV